MRFPLRLIMATGTIPLAVQLPAQVPPDRAAIRQLHPDVTPIIGAAVTMTAPAAVYAVVFGMEWPEPVKEIDFYRPRTVYVCAQSATFTNFFHDLPHSSPASRAAWGQIPRALQDSLRAMLAHPRLIAASTLPPRARLQTGVRTHGVVFRVSPVAFNLDSTEALVYVETDCGPVCAGGDIEYLRKAGRDWVIADGIGVWRS